MCARVAQDDLEDTYIVDPCDRDVWKSSVRSAMCAASQLAGRDSTDVDDAPASEC